MIGITKALNSMFHYVDYFILFLWYHFSHLQSSLYSAMLLNAFANLLACKLHLLLIQAHIHYSVRPANLKEQLNEIGRSGSVKSELFQLYCIPLSWIMEPPCTLYCALTAHHHFNLGPNILWSLYFSCWVSPLAKHVLRSCYTAEWGICPLWSDLERIIDRYYVRD